MVEVLPPGIDVIVSNHPERWAAMLAPLHPDLIICAGMPWLIPPEVVALPRLGAINFHPAALPKHRGPNAVEWAIRNGDPELGFSVHRIGGDFDNGPILAQGAVPIDDDDDMRTLLGKFGPLLPKLLGQAIARVARGETGDPQDESKASYAGMLEPEWREIDWSRSAREIHNQIRSWTGFREVPHGAFGEVDGERLQITRTRLLLESATGSPGAVLRRDDETIVIQCGDGPLELIAWSGLDRAVEAGS